MRSVMSYLSSPGVATYTDKLFKFRNGRWEDILSDEVNRGVASRFAGRSVACVDRTVSVRAGRMALQFRDSDLSRDLSDVN